MKMRIVLSVMVLVVALLACGDEPKNGGIGTSPSLGVTEEIDAGVDASDK